MTKQTNPFLRVSLPYQTFAIHALPLAPPPQSLNRRGRRRLWIGAQPQRVVVAGYKGTPQLGIELKETMKFQLKF